VHDFSSRSGEFRTRRGKRRFDDDEPTSVKRIRRRTPPPIEEFDATDGLPEGDRWSTGRTPAGWSPNWPPSTPSSAS